MYKHFKVFFLRLINSSKQFKSRIFEFEYLNNIECAFCIKFRRRNFVMKYVILSKQLKIFNLHENKMKKKERAHVHAMHTAIYLNLHRKMCL